MKGGEGDPEMSFAVALLACSTWPGTKMQE